jgi:aminoglycoside phosphotransferase (APT) family kinase protein
LAEERAAGVEAALLETDALSPGARVVVVEQMSGGWSRHSYLAVVERGDGRRDEYVVRVQASGGVLETEVVAEHAVFSVLADGGVAVPVVHGLEPSGENPFGGPFFVMDKAPGQAPNAFRRPDRRQLEADWVGDRGIARGMVANLARLHTLPTDSLPTEIPRRTYPEVVAHWRGVYERYSLVRDPVIEEAFRWLQGRAPAEERTGLVHGDYRIGNALVDAGRVSAVLDWELAYVGDVNYDLGYISLERLAGKHLRAVTPLLGAFAESQWFLSEYERLSGFEVDPETVRTFSVVGILMLLGTINMGSWMYAHDRTADFRLAWARFGTPGLRQELARIMAW